MTRQGYSPSNAFGDDEAAIRRAPANALRARRAARAAGIDFAETATTDGPSTLNFRGPRTTIRRYRRARMIGGAAVAALVAAGAVTLIQNSNAAAAPNPNCTLIVPANPLTAAGLATPYQLVATNPRMGQCHEANAAQSAYVQGAIITADGSISLYNPLVIDAGTQAAAPPAAATVPAGATVGLWFGFNGTNLTLKAARGTNSLQQGMCVNGSGGTIFGQFAHCNGPAFFTAANAAIAAGKLVVPAVGTAKDGKPCPTLRDFSVVDQDQSDNVTTHYLATAKGLISQPNMAARNALKNQQLTDLFNASDNRLIDAFIDPALGCTPWTKPEQSNDNQPASSLPLNELQAAAHQAAPVALVPMNDPMVLLNNAQNAAKTTAYRAGVDQGAVGAAGADAGNGVTYCNNLFKNPAGIQRVFADQALFMNAPSPDAAMANNLFSFLAMRGNQSFTNLACTGNNPIQLVMKNNIVIGAKFVGAAAGAGAGKGAGAGQGGAGGQAGAGKPKGGGRPWAHG